MGFLRILLIAEFAVIIIFLFADLLYRLYRLRNYNLASIWREIVTAFLDMIDLEILIVVQLDYIFTLRGYPFLRFLLNHYMFPLVYIFIFNIELVFVTLILQWYLSE